MFSNTVFDLNLLAFIDFVVWDLSPVEKRGYIMTHNIPFATLGLESEKGAVFLYLKIFGHEFTN